MKRLAAVISTVILFAVSAHAQMLPIPGVTKGSGAVCSPSDTFTGADHDPLSANWTATIGSWEILSNSAGPATDSAICIAKWNACTPTNDQFAQGVVAAITTGDYIGLIVRGSGTGGTENGYLCQSDASNNIYLQRIDAGVRTILAGPTGNFAASDTVHLKVEGTTITCTAGVNTLTATDATYASGWVGIWGFSTLPAGSRWDNFTAGTSP